MLGRRERAEGGELELSGATKATEPMTQDRGETSYPSVGSVIVIVEDDASLRRALERLLRAAGFTVRAFRSAEEFLQGPCEPVPDCFVLDIHLGGLNAFSLHELLRDRGMTAPTIFMTGHDDLATRERARRAGAAGYLRKPFEEGDLISAIEQAVAPG